MLKTSKISVTSKNSSNLLTKKLVSIFVGIYVAMFWVADAKYGNAISRLEARTTNLVTRLESEQWRKAIELAPNLQNRKIPVRPSFFYPPDVIYSLIPFYDKTDSEIIEELQDLIISKKSELHNLDLKYVILEKSDFSKSNLRNSNFQNSNLKRSNFSNSTLNYASLENSHLESVDFTSSELQGTILTGSNMEGCILTKAKLFGTKLVDVNLSNSNLSCSNLHLSNLSGATLYNSDLSQSNLVGVNFENVEGLDKANLSNAKYNSTHIEQHELPLYNAIITQLCEKLNVENRNMDPLFHEDCIQEILKDFELSYGPPTKFPENFDPRAHGMIDISEILAKIKEG